MLNSLKSSARILLLAHIVFFVALFAPFYKLGPTTAFANDILFAKKPLANGECVDQLKNQLPYSIPEAEARGPKSSMSFRDWYERFGGFSPLDALEKGLSEFMEPDPDASNNELSDELKQSMQEAYEVYSEAMMNLELSADRDQKMVDAMIKELSALQDNELGITFVGQAHAADFYYQAPQELLDATMFTSFRIKKNTHINPLILEVKSRIRTWDTKIKKKVKKLKPQFVEEYLAIWESLQTDILKAFHTEGKVAPGEQMAFNSLRNMYALHYQYQFIEPFKSLNQRLGQQPFLSVDPGFDRRINKWVIGDQHGLGEMSHIEALPDADEVKQLGFERVVFYLEGFVYEEGPITPEQAVELGRFRNSLQGTIHPNDVLSLEKYYDIPFSKFLFSEKLYMLPQESRLAEYGQYLEQHGIEVEYRGIDFYMR